MATELPAPASITLRRRIAWMDTDAAGIYHYTTVFRLAEEAEAALHTRLGVVETMLSGCPRVNVGFEFRRSLRFNDEVDVHLAVDAVGTSSATYAIAITGAEGIAAEGTITVVFLDTATGQARPWPDDVREALTAGGAHAA